MLGVSLSIPAVELGLVIRELTRMEQGSLEPRRTCLEEKRILKISLKWGTLSSNSPSLLHPSPSSLPSPPFASLLITNINFIFLQLQTQLWDQIFTTGFSDKGKEVFCVWSPVTQIRHKTIVVANLHVHAWTNPVAGILHEVQ